MAPIPRPRRNPGVLAARLGRVLSFLGCALSIQTTPAAAQTTIPVPPSRDGHVAAPPWSGVGGGAELPPTRARVSPTPVRHPAIHPAESPWVHRRPLFPRAHQLQHERRAREAAMERHPAGKGLESPTVPRSGSQAQPDAGRHTSTPPVVTQHAVEATMPAAAPSAATCDLNAYRVRPDDSLWAISRKLVGPAASLADVDALTDQIFEINLSTIGHNPDLIRPGQSLSLPKDCPK